MNLTASAAPARPLVNKGIVRAHLAAAMVAFVISLLSGFFFSLLFLQNWRVPGSQRISGALLTLALL